MSLTKPSLRVGVTRGQEHGPHQPLFKALEELFPIQFVEVQPAELDALDGLIVTGGDISTGMAAAGKGVPSYVAASAPRLQSSTLPSNTEITFGTSTEIDVSLRGRTLRAEAILQPTPVRQGDQVLASAGHRPIWLVRSSDPGTASCHISGASLPQLKQNDFLFQHLDGRRFAELLPLLNFLRVLTRDIDWQAPGSPACLVIDDPSLYWRSYGHVHFHRLAECAARLNFCVAVATIPLDTWWVNRGVADTFRSNNPRLSLLIHGNNHTSREMLLQNTGRAHLLTAAQAMRRMERLERRHGIPFLKIMEAPHGALAEGLFEQLLALGYEAALCTPELLVKHNPTTPWPACFGMRRSELLGGGLPVLPRIKMSPDWRNDVILKAFLRQPIVIAGHHYDAANEMELMVELADLVGGISSASWSDLHGVLQSNYLWKTDGDCLRVRMYSRCTRVPVPAGAKYLIVERPWISPDHTETLCITAQDAPALCLENGPATERVTLPSAGNIQLSSRLDKPLPPSDVPAPRPNPWPIARKILMEIRDRLSPMLPRIDRLCRQGILNYENPPPK